MAMTAKQKREAREQSNAAAKVAAEGAPAGTPITEIEKLNAQQFKDPGSSGDAHGDVVRGPQSGDTVTVGCKLGVAYFSIQLCNIVEKFEQNMQGGRIVKEAERTGMVYRLRGTAYPRGTPPDGFPPPPIIVDGAAMNPGIPAEFWFKWLEQNRLNPMVQNHMIFAHAKDDHVHGMARDFKGLLSGLDPVNPKGDVRVPKSQRRDEVSDIEPGKRPAAA